jgi:hypothetical protein
VRVWSEKVVRGGVEVVRVDGGASLTFDLLIEVFAFASFQASCPVLLLV